MAATEKLHDTKNIKHYHLMCIIDSHRESEFEKGSKTRIMADAELTADIAIKFAKWSYGEWTYEDSRFYHETSMQKSLTDEEAFDYFIENIYKPE